MGNQFRKIIILRNSVVAGCPGEDPSEDLDDLEELRKGVQVNSSPWRVILEYKARSGFPALGSFAAALGGDAETMQPHHVPMAGDLPLPTWRTDAPGPW